MNELIIANTNDGKMLDILREQFEQFDSSDLSGGIAASYPILSFKGKVWRVKHKGEETKVLNADGDPVSTLHAIIVKASPKISKIFYAKNYTEGDDANPDCFSLDGIHPDPTVENPPCATCANCPKNAWGSKITDNGQKLKACSDAKRLAVVPYPDVTNDGAGPMLLRIPPASLQNLAALQKPLDRIKLPYQAVVVKIGFDNELAYPKLVFTPVKAIDQDEARVIRAHLASPELERMLNEPSKDEIKETGGTARAAAAEGSLSERASVKEKPASEPEKASVKEAEAATVKQTAMDEGESVGGEEADEIAGMLAGILND